MMMCGFWEWFGQNLTSISLRCLCSSDFELDKSFDFSISSCVASISSSCNLTFTSWRSFIFSRNSSLFCWSLFLRRIFSLLRVILHVQGTYLSRIRCWMQLSLSIWISLKTLSNLVTKLSTEIIWSTTACCWFVEQNSWRDDISPTESWTLLIFSSWSLKLIMKISCLKECFVNEAFVVVVEASD